MSLQPRNYDAGILIMADPRVIDDCIKNHYDANCRNLRSHCRKLLRRT